MSLNLQTQIVTTSPYTINKDDTLILVNRNSPSSVILPSLSGDSNAGKSFYIKDFSGTSTTNPITITAPSNKTINGVSFAMLNGAYSHIQLAYDGTNWVTVA
jgi:hypothetical protein